MRRTATTARAYRVTIVVVPIAVCVFLLALIVRYDGQQSSRGRGSASPSSDIAATIAPPSTATTGEPAAADAGTGLSLASAVRDALAQFHVLLQRNAAYASWHSCSQSCGALLEELLDTTLADFWRFVETDAFQLAGVLQALPEGEALTFLEARLADADQFDRVALLAIMDRTPDLAQRTLPANMYERLGDRPGAESRLVLGRHGVVPLEDPRSVATVTRLAVDEEAMDSVRYAALTALGHEETAEPLVSAVDHLVAVNADASMIGPAADASARCGWLCRTAFERMLRSADGGTRTAAYRALVLVHRSQRAQLRGYLEAQGYLDESSSPDADEQFARARTLAVFDER